MTPHPGFFDAPAGADHPTPPHFGDAEAEYRAARNTAALFPRGTRGRIRLRGADALDLLHRTTTADLSTLTPGRVAPTLVQTETARVVDWLTVVRRTEDLLLLCGPGRAEATAAWIDRLVIMEDVTVEVLDEGFDAVEVVGPAAAAVLAESYGAGVSSLVAGHSLDLDPALGVTLFRGYEGQPDSFVVLFEPGADRTSMEQLLAAGRLVPAGTLADDALRVERGRPLVGRELNSDANPLEARLQESVSFTKGCYPGQEVVARLITYSSLKRRLTVFELDRDVPTPEPGMNYPAVDGGAPAGRLTSVARAFHRQAPLALGYVRLDRAAPGTETFFTATDGPVRARVIDDPPAP